MSVALKPLAYNSLWQLRNDSWSSLEESTTQLALASGQQRPLGQLTETVTGLLDVLGAIEGFWAFPGAPAVRMLQGLFAAGQYVRLAAVVGRANRALVTEAYRGGQAWDQRAEDDGYDRDSRPAKQFGSARPYFEVLVVEDLTEEQERALREELRRWRRPDDQFVYEIVVVPSFDEAVMAARLNFRLQACVVRRRFTHRSRQDSPLLEQFAGMDGADDLMDRSPDDRAQVLARTLAKIRPELDLYLMTEISVEDLAGWPATISGASSTPGRGRSSCTCPCSTASRPGTGRRSSARCAPTATGPPASSTRCRSRTASRSSTPTGSGTWSTSTAWRSSWPKRPRPAAAWTRCSSPPDRCARRSSSRRRRSARGRPISSPTARRPPTRSSSRRWCSPATSSWSTATATSRTTTG